jgi:hypothetical protein
LHFLVFMRASRYPLELPVRYRSVSDREWSTGTTANISRSGVLFRGDTSLGVDTEIELDISLSTISLGADIVCRARVVRSEPSNVDAAPLLAAVFSSYWFQPAA